MKRLLTSVVVLGLLGLGNGVANANDLINPNLDTIAIGPQIGNTPTGWSVDASKAISGPNFDGCSSELWANVAGPSGHGLFFKPFQGTVGDEITVHFYQDNPATPGTKYTLSGYAAGEPNYSGFFNTNSPAPATLFVIQFLDVSSVVLASNVFDLVANGLPIGGGVAMLQLTTPQVTAPAGTVTVRAGASMINAYGTGGGQAFMVDAFNLTSVAPPGAPVITNQPSHKTVSAGANTSFNVGVSNTPGVSYEWQLYTTNLVNGGSISGAASPTLTITGVSASDVGHYRVRVTNGGGSVLSAEATLQIVGIGLYPAISIEGKIGDVNVVEYSTVLAPTTWIPLSTNQLTSSPLLVFDTTSPGPNTRFYRAVYQP